MSKNTEKWQNKPTKTEACPQEGSREGARPSHVGTRFLRAQTRQRGPRAPAGRRRSGGALSRARARGGRGPSCFGRAPSRAGRGRGRHWGGTAGAPRRRAGGGRPRDMTAGRQTEGADADAASARAPSGVVKLLSALFYGACSFLIVLVNKALLTTYR